MNGTSKNLGAFLIVCCAALVFFGVLGGTIIGWLLAS